MKKIVITGAKGTIGTILKKGLQDKYNITEADLPEVDIRDYNKVLKVFHKKNVVIHLAWNAQSENFRSERRCYDNMIMADNVYLTADEKRVKRVIIASSIHADNFYDWNKEKNGLLTPKKDSLPSCCFYGSSKKCIEETGKCFASFRGLEVICIRFGGVNLEDKIDKTEEGFEKIWLSHRDCVNLVDKCIEIESIPNNFQIIYAVSNNSSKIHDISNMFNWIHQDDSEYKLKTQIK